MILVALPPRMALAQSADDGFNPGANLDVPVLAVQADGKIVVGGRIHHAGGKPRDYIGRLNADGTVDTAFNPGATSYVDALALQVDGKIMVGGDFGTLGGQTRNYIGRVFAYYRWTEMLDQEPTPGGLVKFHTAHKLTLMVAHSPT